MRQADTKVHPKCHGPVKEMGGAGDPLRKGGLQAGPKGSAKKEIGGALLHTVHGFLGALSSVGANIFSRSGSGRKADPACVFLGSRCPSGLDVAVLAIGLKSSVQKHLRGSCVTG